LLPLHIFVQRRQIPRWLQRYMKVLIITITRPCCFGTALLVARTGMCLDSYAVGAAILSFYPACSSSALAGDACRRCLIQQDSNTGLQSESKPNCPDRLWFCLGACGLQAVEVQPGDRFIL
jgi:hypothetical protein